MLNLAFRAVAGFIAPNGDAVSELDILYPSHASLCTYTGVPPTTAIATCSARCARAYVLHRDAVACTWAAVVELCNDPARNVFEVFTKNFRAMDEAVQVLALRCWRVVAYSILSLPRNSVTRRELVVKLLLTGGHTVLRRCTAYHGLRRFAISASADTHTPCDVSAR